MKLILAQPAVLRFRWELEVLLSNVRSLTDMDVVLLFSKPPSYDASLASYLVRKYPNVEAFVYQDNRHDKTYIPSIRPYLWWQHLKHDPAREQESYFYIDSDVIFREWPSLDTLDLSPHLWQGSSCDNYINYDYIKQTKQGPEIIKHMAQICGITERQMIGVPGIGAQLVIDHPTAAFWQRAFDRSVIMWHYFDGVDSNIQKWTAEMWAQLWTMVEFGIQVESPKELDFCMADEPVEHWDKMKIMHNAGVGGTGSMFFKGAYNDKMPFGEDFSYVDITKCSRKYVDAIERVVF